MRLGEASGAVLAFGIIDAALAIHNTMGTFAESGVSEPVGRATVGSAHQPAIS